MLELFAIFLLVAVIVMRIKGRNRQRLRQSYEDALKRDDKNAALKAGSIYYSTVNKKKKLTADDLQVIENDISAMKING